MAKNNWTYDETLVAFELYCRIPFGQRGHRNKEVIILAELLNRTPSAVAMKLNNLARLDPEEIARGAVGLLHGAQMESIVWNDFHNNNEETILKAVQKRELLELKAGKKLFNDDESIVIPVGTDREAFIKQRVGQTFFRSTVLAAYNYRCCFTGISVPDFLIASHIKPWSKSNPQERTNPRNGLCINALHDKAFDKGYLTLTKDFKIVVSDKLKTNKNLDAVTQNFICSCDGKNITLPDKFKPNIEYIEYHNDLVFLR